MRRMLPFATAAILSVSAACAGTAQTAPGADDSTANEILRDDSRPDTALTDDASELVSLVLTEMPKEDEKVKYETLTEEDFKSVAEELGVEVAAIKAVVKIEAGPKLQGFWAPGVPVANYVQSLYNKYSAKTKGRKVDAKVPSGLSGYALKEWTSLTNARKKNADAADMGTYWGMFQIGGFNYKLCGCKSVQEMVEKVCESEFSQLEMFAVFIRNSGMLDALRKKDWAAFARKYNGPSYAKRGYHTRMAKEYANYKNEKKPTDKK
ncbi:MAG: N-acetylmuramidase family protein [Muribaculaceae bacterium]|nr:N-acetylmuramidase family protein [Muribaculaceae bacterium]